MVKWLKGKIDELVKSEVRSRETEEGSRLPAARQGSQKFQVAGYRLQSQFSVAVVRLLLVTGHWSFGKLSN